ncbi:MAG: PAS domain S-box protein, partial [bacterium]
MKDKQSESKQAAELRQRAEAQVRARDVAQPAQLTPAQTGQLTYELQVHQVELEIQNEELRQTHAVLTASQARYFDLYDLAPVGYLTLSGNGLIQEANLTAATLLGVARTALIQGTFISFVFKDDQDKFHRYLHQLGTAPAPAGAGQPQQCEVRLLRAQAAPFWAQLEATVMHDAAGVQGRNIVVIDITSRKLAEEALTKMSSLILESQRIAHLGSFEYVADTGITIWSEEEFKIYGLDPSGPSPDYEVMLAKHIHPDDAAHLNEVFVNAMHNGAIYELEHRIVQPDGSVRFVHDRAHPIFDSQGKLLRYVGATLDITERKITEKKMEMIQSELMQAQKMESVGRLAGGVAHDFNNLLMGIMGYAELGLLDLPPEHPVRGELESIIATAKRSADLTRQLLAFARKQIIAPKVLDLNDTVESMLKLLRRLVGEDINL